jgi:hypothetical protein
MSKRALSYLGVDFATVERDDAQWSEDLRGLRLWREEFERLLRLGLSRAEANHQLSQRILNGEEPPELRS